MTDPREALVALVDATLRPFQVDPKRGPSDAVGAIADAILAEFDVTERGEDAQEVPDSPHGMWCPPGCGHDRSEAAAHYCVLCGRFVAQREHDCDRHAERQVRQGDAR